MSQITILLVEDSATNRQMIGQFITRLGYRCAVAVHGLDALAYCQENRPDLILMDVVMPEMDGLQATEALRELFGESWVPIIFLTSQSELESVVLGLKAGGDDYLAKPVNFDLLAAKIQVFLRIAEMQEQINQDAIRLEKYYQANEEEQRLTLELIERLNEQYTSPQPHVWQHLSPATHFNGDLICICPSPSGQEHIMLADCTGHGLAAAISALPVVDCFYEMTRNGSALSDIAAGINKKIYKLLPRSRFVAAALISIDHKTGTINVWNGGIPCVLLFSTFGKLAVRLKPRHPPLGILPEEDFDKTTQALNFHPHDMLVVSSDGITESKNCQGAMFGVEGVIEAVKSTEGKSVGDHVLKMVSMHLEGNAASDDVSLLVIDCIQKYNNI